MATQEHATKPLLFSEWLRTKMQDQTQVGAVARAWNALPSESRKGRVNAARIDRVLGTNQGGLVITKYAEETGRNA
jgi:hypothetical protein